MSLLLNAFSNISDPRKDINITYDMLDILFIALAGVLSGAEGWSEIHQFAHEKQVWLKKYRKLESGIPSEDTISRVIRGIEPIAFNQAFMTWVNSVREISGQPLIAIDGKTLKLSRDGEKHNALHSITVWCQQNDLVLAEMKSKAKKNEQDSVLEILDLLDIDGAIITVDAMNSQKKIAKKIIERKADYIFCIKDNHKNLAEEIRSYFHKIQRDQPTLISEYEEVDAGHGRIEIRRCQTLSADSWITELQEWVSVQTVVLLERTRINKKSGKEEKEQQIYISSLQTEAKIIAPMIRQHWGIENKVHWLLDVVYKEDDCRIRKDDGAENVAIIRRFCLNLLKLHPKKCSMKSKLKQAGWSDEFRSEILFGQNID